jgi:inorganic triphosphatase YgiF
MEIELKLRLPPAALDALRADPLLAGAPASHKVLDNIYFDTPARALAKARIGLRLRRDGERWLQTVKGGGGSRAGLHRREEIEFPVAGPELEWAPLKGSAFEVVLARERPGLAPLFRTRFKRDIRLLQGAAGGSVELAIDQGEIIAGDRSEPLCEVELELHAGPVDDLFSVALLLAERHPLVLDNRSKAERGLKLADGTGLPPPSKADEVALPADADARVAVREAIAHALAHWHANEAGFLSHPDNTEYLHQLRVAVRRLRVACGSLARAAAWHIPEMWAINDGLRALGQQLGAARDWDVLLEEIWPPLASQLADLAARQLLAEAALKEQATARAQAQAALGERACQRALLQLGRCLAMEDDATPVSFDGIEEELSRLESRLREAHGQIKQLSPARQHRLRITAKKLRYLTEFIGSRYDKKATDEWLDWLRHAQSALGARNDRETAQARIDALCRLLGARTRATRKTLHDALNAQPAHHLDLPEMPKPYWHKD